MVGLKASYEKLYERIDERIEKRLGQGLLAEIKELLKKGYSFDNSVLGTTLAYKEWRECFKNSNFQFSIFKQKKEEIIERWKYNEHHYARRQMTWFKKEKRIAWFDITADNFPQNVEKLIEEWYDKNVKSQKLKAKNSMEIKN